MISVQQISAMISQGKATQLIDVRTPAEFEEVHAQGARLMPLDSLDVQALGPGPFYLICKTGTRAAKAVEKLNRSGIAEAYCVQGGTEAWAKAGLPLVRGRKCVSLERQVRIAAGALVLVGLGLGMLVHPAWYGLGAFVGAGLIFAGLTDRCGMAMLLAKMPWNQRRTANECATKS